MALDESRKKERSRYLEENLVITECSQRKPYVFVSYASDSWETVFKDGIVPMQRQYGMRVYADKAFDEVNDRWIVPMLRNIRGADAVVAFVSQSYIESYACFLEMLTAINNRKQIVFVFIENDLHLGDTADQPVIERGAKNEMLNQGSTLSTNTNNTSNDIMRAMKTAFTSISTLMEQDALSKYDISDAFISFFRDASVNRKTLNDLKAIKRTIASINREVFDLSLTEQAETQAEPEAQQTQEAQAQRQTQPAQSEQYVRPVQQESGKKTAFTKHPVSRIAAICGIGAAAIAAAVIIVVSMNGGVDDIPSSSGNTGSYSSNTGSSDSSTTAKTTPREDGAAGGTTSGGAGWEQPEADKVYEELQDMAKAIQNSASSALAEGFRTPGALNATVITGRKTDGKLTVSVGDEICSEDPDGSIATNADMVVAQKLWKSINDVLPPDCSFYITVRTYSVDGIIYSADANNVIEGKVNIYAVTGYNYAFVDQDGHPLGVWGIFIP